MTAKASTLTTVIPEAEATGRCEVRPDSYVARIETNAQGRTTGVAYYDGRRGVGGASGNGSRERFQKARAVVVCANGAETPRLLLMSANARFPQGLANSSGLVGKYLMFNYNSRALGLFEHELNEHKSVQVSRIVMDFYNADPKRGFYGGGGLDALLGRARDVSGIKVLGVRTEVTDRAALRELAERLRDKLGEGIVLVGSVHEGKAQLVLTVAKPLTARYKAGDLIRPIAALVGGSGGGRPDMAQAGGTDPSRLDEAIEAVYAGVAA